MFHFVKSFQAFFSLLSRMLVAQFHDIFYELDLVKDVTEAQYNAIMAKATAEKDKPYSLLAHIWRKRIFIFPFCTLAQHPLDTLLVFARYHFKYDPHGMPELLSHRFFPRTLWAAGDPVINFGFPIAFFVHLFMLIYPDMDPNYVIYAVKSEQKNRRIRVYSHGKQWPKRQAERLLTFRAKGLAASRFVMVTAFIQTAGYFCGNNFINSKPFESWPQFCFMLFSPFVALWADFGVVFTSFYIALTGHYTYIKQQFILAKIKSLTKKLSKKRHPTIAEWNRFTVINTEVLKLFDEIRMYNRFWAPFLTVTFLQYTINQVLCVHIFFFGPSDSTVMMALKGVCMAAITEMTILLFGLVDYCARVVKKNGQITRLNRQFAVHCLRNQRRYRLSILQLLKLELFAWPRLLHFYAFKVFGGSRITSKTFYVMTINIIGFFLFVMKRIQ